MVWLDADSWGDRIQAAIKQWTFPFIYLSDRSGFTHISFSKRSHILLAIEFTSSSGNAQVII
jgi:hypothetical protein